MRRRDVIRVLGAAAALPFIPGTAEAAEWTRQMHEAVRQGRPFRTLTGPQQLLVSEIADRLIPRTDTPGALDVGVPQFVDLLLTDWYDESDTRAFLTGLDDIDARARAAGSLSFVALDDSGKATLMRALDDAREAKDGGGAAFARLKGLTVYGYFTSERIVRDVLRSRTSFQSFEGCVPLTS
jgi:hypothetical protein